MAANEILAIILGGPLGGTVGGAIGGFLSHIHVNNGVTFPYWITDEEEKKRTLKLGFWNEVFLGIGAGLIATLPLDLSFGKSVYPSIIAGIGGGNFIAKRAKEFAESKLRSTEELPVLNPVEHQTDAGYIEVETEDIAEEEASDDGQNETHDRRN